MTENISHFHQAWNSQKQKSYPNNQNIAGIALETLAPISIGSAILQLAVL